MTEVTIIKAERDALYSIPRTGGGKAAPEPPRTGGIDRVELPRTGGIDADLPRTGG